MTAWLKKALVWVGLTRLLLLIPRGPPLKNFGILFFLFIQNVSKNHTYAYELTFFLMAELSENVKFCFPKYNSLVTNSKRIFDKFLQTKLFWMILVNSLSQKLEKKKVSLESAPQILSIKISKPQNLLSTSWTSRLVKVRFKILFI